MAVRRSKYQPKTGKPKWEVDYSDQSGVRRLRTFDTRRAADAFDQQVKAEKAAGVHVADRETVSISAAAQAFLAAMQKQGAAPTTVAFYEGIIRLHVVPFLGAVPANRLTPSGVQKWLDALDASGRSADMCSRARKTLMAIVDEAVRTGRAAVNPVRAAKARPRPRRADMSDEIVIPPAEAVAALIGAARAPLRQMLMLSAICGLRWGEIRGLRWRDIGEDVVSVRQAVDRLLNIGPPKTQAARRDVPLPARVRAELAGLRGDSTDDQLVFRTRTGAPISLTNIANRWLRPLFASMGIEWFHPHTFRHFAVSMWRAGGVEWPVIAEWIGHTKVSFTMDTYGHLFPDEAATAARRVAHSSLVQPLLGA